MKNVLTTLFFLSAILLFACKKDNPSGGIGSSSGIRYEFTADVPAAYRISTLTGTLGYDETISGTSWSKTVASPPKTAASDTASLIVFAPDSWMNTQNQANITMKIFVNDILKGSKSMVLIWVDRPSGNQLKVAY